MKKIIAISSHALFNKDADEVYGTGSSLSSFLRTRRIQFLFIKHPIYGGFPTKVESFLHNRNLSYKLTHKNSTSLIIKSIQEFLIIVKLISKLEQKPTVFIGIDPLNALFGLWAKKLGLAEKVFFYTADYTKTRFDNKFFNKIYHFIDRWVIKRADEIWSVSTRITKLRKKQGVPTAKNFFIPNSPAFYKIKRLAFKNINRHELITVSTSAKNTNLPVIIEALKILSKKYSDITLKIIGLDNWKEELQGLLKKNGLEGKVIFKSCMPHEELINNLCKSGVGLALYTNKFSWTYYSDSMKVRDYLACGLPVVMTDISSTAQDIKEAKTGYVIDFTVKKLVWAIDEIFNNVNNYIRLRKNAIQLAKKYDIEKILERRLVL